MTRNLPPLSALRSFEAAARLQSFSRAADEISVTHGAVSHQVRSLERALGAALFLRNGRRVVLTTAGRHFAERVRAALQDLAEAAQFVRRSEHARAVAAGDLRAGKLVRLFKLAVPAHGATYLVWPKDRLSANAILVRDWLLEERQREG